MSYFIAAISNGGGAPEQAYRKMQAAGACPEKPFAGMFLLVLHLSAWLPQSPIVLGGAVANSARVLCIDSFSFLKPKVKQNHPF